MSIPAETPEEVTRLPSRTQRARLTHVTFGPCDSTHANERLFEVALRPSRTPARASQAAPLHTPITISAVAARAAIHPVRSPSLTPVRVPIPPGTRRRSSGG